MLSIIDNFTYIVSALLVGRMYVGFEVEKRRIRKLVAALISVIFAFCDRIFQFELLSLPLFLVTLIFVVRCFFNVGIKTSFLFSLIFVNIHAVTYIGAEMFVKSASTVFDLKLDRWLDLICSVGILVLILLFGMLARKYTVLGTRMVKRRKIVGLLAVLVIDVFILVGIGYLILMTAPENYRVKASFLYILISLDIVAQVVVIIYLATAKDVIKEREELVERYLKEQKLHYEYLSKKEYETKKFRHDIKNHLNVLSGLCQEKDIEGIERYLSQINANVEKISGGIKTHNDIADAIFNRYYHNCMEQGIKLDVLGHFPNECNVDAFDICTILSNLLDNAQRAEQETEEKLITVRIRHTDDDEIMIVVENDIGIKPVQSNGRFSTTKKDIRNHGFGLENIKECVERYHGITDITTENNKFRVRICLDNSKPEDSSCR